MDWFLPAFKAGGPIVSISNLIENYNENIQYKIFCSDNDLGNKKLPNIKRNEWVNYNEYTQVWYSSSKSIKLFKKLIREYCPDVLFIIGIYSFYFNLVPLIYGNVNIKIISPRGMLMPEALGQKKFKKSIFLFFFKLYFRKWGKIIFHATNNIEKTGIQNIFGSGVKVYIAENFPRKIILNDNILKIKGDLKLVTIALISPMKNFKKVFEALRYCNFEIIYDIFGPVKEAEYWAECLKLIENLPPNIKVSYHGDVEPYKIPSILEQSHIYIQPSKSENFGHSLFEALSAGKPVITSQNTPWNDLKNLKAGINIDPENINEIKESIDFFAGLDNNEYIIWSKSASSYALHSINFKKINVQYSQMFDSI